MKDSIHDYMKVGIIHFMIYPETMKGEGPILETLEKICKDDFFSAIEISWMKDAEVRKKAKELLEQSHLTVAYGAQPTLLVNKYNVNSLDQAERKKVVEFLKERINEASELGAKAVAILSGADPGPEKREEAKKALVESLVELSNYAQTKNLNFVLETFDRDIDKKALIGPSDEAVKIAKEVRKTCKNFGLMVDLSHMPLLNETPKQSLTAVKDYLVHIHMGNCIMKDKAMTGYGDQHPRFGISTGENGVKELTEFLKCLFDIGYLGKKTDNLPIVSFEVKPLPGENSEVLIANSKRVLREAWSNL
ncbi:MAG: xylose isomerase [Elusimicrobia bacterium RIFOXYA2_FULL_39_19]|nr:MAG: xylose isomerase [Elusimicrobia bacterium RIFOXYA2_FULL_39_19]